MTDKVIALVVALEEPLREDDAKALIKAIRQLRGVAGVSTEVADYAYYAAHRRARLELTQQLWDVLNPPAG